MFPGLATENKCCEGKELVFPSAGLNKVLCLGADGRWLLGAAPRAMRDPTAACKGHPWHGEGPVQPWVSQLALQSPWPAVVAVPEVQKLSPGPYLGAGGWKDWETAGSVRGPC